MQYDSGYEKRQRAFHHNDDMHISVKELWEAWLRSEVLSNYFLVNSEFAKPVLFTSKGPLSLQELDGKSQKSMRVVYIEKSKFLGLRYADDDDYAQAKL